MAFGPQYKSQRFQIKTNGVSADSPEVQKRLDRIERNYSALELILDDLESRIDLDGQLGPNSNAAKDELPRKPR